MELNGILLIDKPKGMSSFDVIRKVRKTLGVKKVGHAGTLDPLASGLMLIALGKYTKLCGYLTLEDKIYQTTFFLGKQTNTDDSEGQVIAEKDISNLTKAQIEKALAYFTGKITQVPPKFSAIKVNGVRAYNLARSNEEIELKPREVEVFSIERNGITLPHLYLTIHCSKGTYIRSIARDLGQMLNVGAYALDIRRIKSGLFDISQAIQLSDLTQDNFKDFLLSGPSEALGIEIIHIDEHEMKKILVGGSLDRKVSIKSSHGLLAFENQLVAIVQKNDEHVKTIRVM